MKKIALFLSLLFPLASHAEIPASPPIPVVASFSILGDMVQEIGGEAVTVQTLVGADSDAHGYQPTPQDAAAVSAAKVIFINGLGFEGWMTRLVKSTGAKGEVVTVSQGISPIRMKEHGKTITDPHAWQNLAYGKIYAQNIAAALIHAVPGQKAMIEKRAADFEKKIHEKDQWVKSQFANIPANQRKIITGHDAFGYFAAAYGIAVLAPQGFSTESEPTAAGVAKLTRQIKEEGVKTFFVENMTNPKLINQLGRDTGAKMGSTLYSDALSAAGGDAPTYLSMFDHNVPQMAAAMREINPNP